jgi:predicted O-linked N-acetylglucosamine transferase (SPINDLY family)
MPPKPGPATPPGPNLAADSTKAAQLLANGKPAEAAQIYAALLANHPTNASLYFNLACALQGGGRQNEAIAHYLAALQLQPTLVSAANNLANAFMAMGRQDDAATYFRLALAADPNHANALVCLGGLLLEAGEDNQALQLLERAVARHPQNFNARVLLVQACDRADQRDEADMHLAKAAELKPDDANVRNNIGTRILSAGRTADAVREMERAVALDPTAAMLQSNLILGRLYLPALSALDHLAEARKWNERHGKPRIGRLPAPTTNRDPERPLRIGYVSADFYRHPVGFFMNGPLAHHDRTNFKIHCYSGGRPDAYTEQLRHKGDTWRDVRRVSDDDLARTIRQDGIDILVDLAGHTAANRLPVFAMRAAPVQIVGGGHTGTTGLDAIDYLISDSFETPEGYERFYSETLLRMPHDYVCYTPPAYAPEINELPAVANGAVTFCCYNNIAKLNNEVVAVWAEILKQLPGSRLKIEARPLRQATTADRLRSLFMAEGIAGERILLGGGAPHEKFLDFYLQVDAALDPFPYSGGLTTLESLWMGVPVVTMPGEGFATRHSLSHLSNLGLPELAARNRADYIRIAVDLANDRTRLAELRRTLRPRMAQSPLTDAVGYTRALERAYRTVWRTWCKGDRSIGI